MPNRTTQLIRIALGAIAAAGMALYLWGMAVFAGLADVLYDKGFDDPLASGMSHGVLVVAEAYRQFLPVDIANAASCVAAMTLILALSWQGGRTFRLPHRAALVFGLPLSFTWFAYSLIINGDITSLDHLATGILRYDEDSWGEPIAVFLMAPCVFILWGFSGLDYARTFARTSALRANAFLVVLTLAMLWIGGSTLCTDIFAAVRYDKTSPHSFLGPGPLLLLAWLAGCLIIGRAAAFTAPKARK